MNIPLHRDRSRGMTQNLRKALNLKADFNAARRESMPKSMEVNVLNSTVFRVFFQTVLERPRLDKIAVTGQYVGVPACIIHTLAELDSGI